MNICKQSAPDRLMSRAQFRSLVGISRTSEWKLGRQGKLPPIIQIEGRKLGYRKSDYDEWLEAHSLKGEQS